MYRKILRAFAAAVLVCAMLTVPASAESATVTASKVNVRSGPGTDFYPISSLERGTVVEVTDKSYGAWYQISHNGVIGFVSSTYLDLASGGSTGITLVPPASGSAAGSTDTVGRTMYINAMYVRFRSGPGSDYPVVGEYNKGKEISVVTTVGDWVAGYIDGNPGYVHKDYVSSGYVSSAAPAGTGQSGITVVSPQSGSSSALPQPNEGIAAAAPSATPTASASSINVQNAPAVQASSITVLPSPNVPAAAPTPTASVRPNNSAAVNADGVKAFIVGTYVRFRTGPGSNYSIIGTYNSGKELVAYANSGNGWLFCSIDGVEGYVHGDYVYVIPDSTAKTNTAARSTEQQNVNVVVAATSQPVAGTNKTAYIIGNNVRFREGASMTSKILGELFYGNQVTVTGTVGEWSQIVYGEKRGYVYSSYVREGTYGMTGASTAGGSTSAVTPSNVSGQDIVNFAGQYLGYKYCWGGTSPDTGFDCSGFVYYVFKHFGFDINRVASDQASNGVHVDPSDLRPGDIICFYSGSSYIGHSGIYIGSNRFIHSSNSTTGVIISEISGYYATRGFEARRMTA